MVLQRTVGFEEEDNLSDALIVVGDVSEGPGSTATTEPIPRASSPPPGAASDCEALTRSSMEGEPPAAS